MALPLIPLAIGAGILALLAFGGGKKTSGAPSGEAPGEPSPVPPTAPPPPTPGAPEMPAAMKAQFDDLLANGVNADGLETVAGEMEKFGFANEGATLRARAAQLRGATAANAAAQAAAAQPPPFVPGTQFVPGVLDEPAPQQPGGIPIPAIPGLIPAGLKVPSAVPAIPGLAIPVIPPPPPAAAVQRAKVTTNDAPPGGDLIMRTSPSDSGAQVPGGGAEKDGIVTIINANASADGVWSEIEWAGGSRRPAARGFAKKKFLVNLPPSPTTSGVIIGATSLRYAKCVAPSGCRLRVAPSVTATFRAMVGSGETVQVLNHARGEKADHGSPGPGGWAHIRYKTLNGWVPSEWLVAA